MAGGSTISPEQPADAERDPFPTRLSLADSLPENRIRELLEARRRELSDYSPTLEAISAPAEAADTGQALRLATLDDGRTVADTIFGAEPRGTRGSVRKNRSGPVLDRA